jgi:hyperosmotically inducible periplasmic protein
MRHSISRAFGDGAKLLAVALAAACSIANGTESADDAAVKAKVQAALNSDSVLYARHIQVSVQQGVVHLAGFVLRTDDIQRAKKDAASVPGVKTVSNEMVLKPGESESSTSH